MSYDRAQLIRNACGMADVAEALTLIATSECERAFEQSDGGQKGAFTTQFSALFHEFVGKRGLEDVKSDEPPAPIPLFLTCPVCGVRHIDEGEFATKPHKNHACQNCGLVWRPALVPTVGVKFLPGCLNEESQE